MKKLNLKRILGIALSLVFMVQFMVPANAADEIQTLASWDYTNIVQKPLPANGGLQKGTARLNCFGTFADNDRGILQENWSDNDYFEFTFSSKGFSRVYFTATVRCVEQAQMRNPLYLQYKNDQGEWCDVYASGRYAPANSPAVPKAYSHFQLMDNASSGEDVNAPFADKQTVTLRLLSRERNCGYIVSDVVIKGQALPLADYSGVNAAIAYADEVREELSKYADFDDINAAIAAVEWDKNINEQEIVDGYAATISAAVEAVQQAYATAREDAEALANLLNSKAKCWHLCTKLRVMGGIYFDTIMAIHSGKYAGKYTFVSAIPKIGYFNPNYKAYYEVKNANVTIKLVITGQGQCKPPVISVVD